MFNKKERLLLFALAFVQFSHIVDFMIMMPLGPQLMRIFSISPQQFGLLVSSYTFAAGATGLLSAFFIDRFDRKSSLIFFYIGFCLGTLACAFAQDYTTLLIFRTLAGAFGGVLSALCLSIVSDAINPERRGSALGILMTAFSVASILGVPFSLFLANTFNWHAPFLFLGGLSFLLLFVIQVGVPSMREHFAMRTDKSSIHHVVQILRNKSQLLAILFTILIVLGQFAVIPFLSPSMVANVGMSEAQLPLIYLVGGIFSILSSPLIGRAADKFGKRRVFYFGVLASTVPFFLITRLTFQKLIIVLDDRLMNI